MLIVVWGDYPTRQAHEINTILHDQIVTPNLFKLPLRSIDYTSGWTFVCFDMGT